MLTRARIPIKIVTENWMEINMYVFRNCFLKDSILWSLYALGSWLLPADPERIFLDFFQNDLEMIMEIDQALEDVGGEFYSRVGGIVDVFFSGSLGMEKFELRSDQNC